MGGNFNTKGSFVGGTRGVLFQWIHKGIGNEQNVGQHFESCPLPNILYGFEGGQGMAVK